MPTFKARLLAPVYKAELKPDGIRPIKTTSSTAAKARKARVYSSTETPMDMAGLARYTTACTGDSWPVDDVSLDWGCWGAGIQVIFEH